MRILCSVTALLTLLVSECGEEHFSTGGGGLAGEAFGSLNLSVVGESWFCFLLVIKRVSAKPID